MPMYFDRQIRDFIALALFDGESVRSFEGLSKQSRYLLALLNCILAYCFLYFLDKKT
jgi:hypothetical protein